MNDAVQKKVERGGRFVAALAMLSCAMLVFAEPVEVGSPGCPHSVSLAGRWRFALGDTTNCTDSIVLPSTTDIAKKGDGRIGGKDVEKIAPERDDAAVTSRLTRHLTRRFPYVGFATYERDVEIPSAWAGRRIELFLERTKVVDAYLDGRRFGRSDTLAAPAVIELPRGTAPGRHTLRLVVDNRRGTVPVTGHQTSDRSYAMRTTSGRRSGPATARRATRADRTRTATHRSARCSYLAAERCATSRPPCAIRRSPSLGTRPASSRRTQTIPKSRNTPKSEHPALAGFPTSFHSDYQWRELIFNGVNVVLDGDKEADVIVRGIDNITRNQNLGVIWEKRRGKGRVLYCSLDLEAAKELPEARALYRSLLDYMKHP